MPGKTLTQRVGELAEKVERYIPVADYRLDELKQDFAALKEQVRRLEELPIQVADLKERVKQFEDLPTQSARHDERLKTVEKGHDRVWQFAPMVISVLAILMSVVVALIKK